MEISVFQNFLRQQLSNKGTKILLTELVNRIDANSPIFKFIFLQQTRINNLEFQKHAGTMSDADYRTAINKINLSLLDLIERIQVGDVISKKSDTKLGVTDTENRVIPSAIFLSMPMASLESNKEFDRLKDASICIQETLNYQLGYHIVYYAGNMITGLDDFNCPEASIKQDLKAIHTCEKFILVYPKALPTSSLIEIGYAIALKKQAYIFTPKREELPFLLQKADTVFPDIRIVEFENLEEVPSLLKLVLEESPPENPQRGQSRG